MPKPTRGSFKLLSTFPKVREFCARTDQRFCQVLVNALYINGIQDPFYIEDDVLDEILNSYIDNFTKGGGNGA